MVTLGTLGGASWFFTRSPKTNTPPINAKNKEEEQFVKYVVGAVAHNYRLARYNT